MTAPRNADVLIDAFLAEGRTDLPDQVFDGVRAEINRTRQRAVLGPWREPAMSTISRVAIAAAVATAIGLAAANLRIGNGPGGPTPPPSATPEATPQLLSGSPRAIAPGRYRVDFGLVPGSSSTPGGPTIDITVPSPGWTNFDNFAIDKNYGQSNSGAGPSFVVWNITNVYVDPCRDHHPASPAPSPGIDAIVEALASQPGIQAGPVTAVTVDGYEGKVVDLTIAADISKCPGGFFTWGTANDGRYAQGTNEVDRVYALDVGGTPLTFFLRIPARTTAADRALLDQVLDSIDIQP